MSEDALRKSLTACNVCNIALVEEVHDRASKGEAVNAICKDLEDFQRQLTGEIVYSWQALKDRYRRAVGLKESSGAQRPSKTNPTKMLKELAEVAKDKDVKKKLKSGLNLPQHPPEPEPDPKSESPALKAFGDITKLLTTVNTKVQQRAHGFDSSQKDTIKQHLSLIFGNLGGDDE